MNEALLIIFVAFAGANTELYEYPVKDMTLCTAMLATAKTDSAVSAFCVANTLPVSK